jgi:hypothetical protein
MVLWKASVHILRATIAGLLVLPALGCGDSKGPKTFPVVGKITVDNEPLHVQKATVVFKPDASKGNQTPYEPVGNVDPDGTYMLVTAGKKGAPPGWYKVIVTAYEAPESEERKFLAPARYQLLVNRKYGSEKTSGLAIEVVENPAPGAYDLRLSK